MQSYKVKLSKQAQKDQLFWLKTSKTTYDKLFRILLELEIHPRSGIGKPEKLKGIPGGWYRRLTDGDRVEYRIDGEKILVDVLSARGHYDDH